MKKIYIILIIALMTMISCTDKVTDPIESKSEIRGTLSTWNTELPVADAKVIIENEVLNVKDSLMSDADGAFVFPDLFPKTYTLTFVKDGFLDTEMDVIAKAGKTIDLDITYVQHADGSELVADKAAMEFSDNKKRMSMKIQTVKPVAMMWNLQIDYADEEGWLDASTSSSMLEYGDTLEIEIEIDRTDMDEGDYAADLVFNYFDNNVAKDVTIPVTMSVNPMGIAYVDMEEIDFGFISETKVFEIENLGAGLLGDWTISTTDSWITIDTPTGSGAGEASVSVNRDNLPGDINEGMITITAAINTVDVGVKVVKADVEFTPIYDLQYVENPDEDDLSTKKGESVLTKGIVTGVEEDGYYISEATVTQEPWKGIYVYDNRNRPSVGDEVGLVGYIDEYYHLTELKSISEYAVLSQGNPVPEPLLVASTADIASNESYEGCLVRIENVTVTSLPDGYGQWYITNDYTDSLSCQVEDNFIKAIDVGIELEVGMEFESITGVISYSYDEFEINPRKAEDLVLRSDATIED